MVEDSSEGKSRNSWLSEASALRCDRLSTTRSFPADAPDAPADLRFSFWVPPAHPLVVATKAWAEDIAKESGGTLTVTIYPSEQLGKAFDHYDMARDGIADIAYVNPGYQPGRFPSSPPARLPFLIANAQGRRRRSTRGIAHTAARK